MILYFVVAVGPAAQMSLSESTSTLIPLIHLTSQLEELLMVGNPSDLLGFGMTSRTGKWAAL